MGLKPFGKPFCLYRRKIGFSIGFTTFSELYCIYCVVLCGKKWHFVARMVKMWQEQQKCGIAWHEQKRFVF